MRNELEFAEHVAEHLHAHGNVELRYITAEFAPFTSQFKPDVLFQPKSGPNRGTLYFVEFKLAHGRPLLPHEIGALVEHRQFAMESIGIPDIRFGYVTDVAVDEISIARLKENG